MNHQMNIQKKKKMNRGDKNVLLIIGISKVLETFGCKVLAFKIRLLAFKGEEPVRSKIVFNNRVPATLSIWDA